MPFFLSFIFLGTLLKEDFLGSGSVMGRLYIGAVLAEHLEQGVVRRYLPRAAPMIFFFSSYLTIKYLQNHSFCSVELHILTSAASK